MDLLRKALAKKAHLRLVHSEANEKRVAKVARTATTFVGVENAEPGYVEEYCLMQTFHQLNKEYTGEFQPPGKLSATGKRFWRKVLNNQKKANTDGITFLRAQFAWFDKVHGCAPEPAQLLTENAVIRAMDFALTKYEHRIVSNGRVMPVEVAELFKACEKQIMQLRKAHQMTRLDVYRYMVIPGLVHLPESFLSLDPAYQEALSGS